MGDNQKKKDNTNSSNSSEEMKEKPAGPPLRQIREDQEKPSEGWREK